jgi:hypothetical protein
MATRKNNRKNMRKNTRKMDGGKRKRAGTAWAQQVKAVFKEMRRTDSTVKLGAAMKEASRRKARGEL